MPPRVNIPKSTASLVNAAPDCLWPSRFAFTDRKSVVEGVTGVQTCALPISLKKLCAQTHATPREHTQINSQSGERRSRLPLALPLRIHRSEERRGGSDWSSDVCSSDLPEKAMRADSCHPA